MHFLGQSSRILWVSVGIFVGLLSPGDAKDARWNQKMQELSKTFSDLMPDIVSSGPVSPAQSRRIENGAKQLMGLAHSIDIKPGSNGAKMLPDADPTIQFVSDYFRREVTAAYANAKNGRAEYARSALRSVSTYCITCHTRHEQGPNFPELNLSTKVDKLAPMDRAQFYTATRQFDKGLEEYEKVISDSKIAKTRPLDWGNAVRQALTIAVRVKRDPKLAGEILGRVQKLSEVPEFYRENFLGWLQAVNEWKKEGDKTLESEEAHYTEAERLYEKAKASQQYPLDHSADVYYLRVSLVIHEMLSKYPSGKRTSEALLLAGAAYDLLENRMMSPLPQNYFEACIRHSPHSDVANRCFRRYEENVYFGFSGSSGTAIPEDIASRLKELRALAKPKKENKAG